MSASTAGSAVIPLSYPFRYLRQTLQKVKMTEPTHGAYDDDDADDDDSIGTLNGEPTVSCTWQYTARALYYNKWVKADRDGSK